MGRSHGGGHHSSGGGHRSSGGGHYSGGHVGGGGHYSGSRPSGGYGGPVSHSARPVGGPRPGYGPRPSGVGYGPRPGMYPPPPPRPYGRPYYRGSYRRSGGCGTFLLAIVILFMIMAIMGQAGGAADTLAVNDQVVEQYAYDQLADKFSGRNDGMVLVLTDNDYCYAAYGSDAGNIMSSNLSTFWDCYDAHYADDLGYQLNGTFTDFSNELKSAGVTPIKSAKGFNKNCYEDHISWVDTPDNLVKGAETFYNTTGIQAYVILTTSSRIAKATDASSNVLIVFIIACAVIIVLIILYKWWQKKREAKKEEEAATERILNTPLQKYGDGAGATTAAPTGTASTTGATPTAPPMDEAEALASKYDETPTDNSNNQ